MKLELIYNQEVLGKEFNIYGDKENPLFLAKDVAEWIDYSKTSEGYYNVATMLRSIDEDEKITINIVNSETNRARNQWFLTEDGLYEVLMQSRKPIAKQFKKEVKKILKQIRKTGGYIPVKEEDDELTIMSKALLIAQKTLEQKDCLIEEQKKTIKTKAIKSPYTIEKVRGVLNCSRHVLENHLYTLGWIKWKEDKNIEITNQGRKYLVFINSRVGRPHIEFTEEGLEEITKGRIMK